MATAIPFDTDFDPAYGVLEDLPGVAGVRRLVAANPGPFTFRGTATFVLGRGEVAVIDAGPRDDAHVQALLAAVAAGGERVTHLLVTHTHPDHSPATAAVQSATRADTFGFGPHPTAPEEPEDSEDSDTLHPPDSERAYEQSADDEEGSGDRSFVPDHQLRTGDAVQGLGWALEAIHTPGHIANHLCFAVTEGPARGTLFTGDHVMGWSTTVISPPTGDLSDYLAGIDTLLARPERLYVPTHGKPIDDGPAFATLLRRHRVERTEQVIAALRAGENRVAAIVERLYVGLDPGLRTAAGRSVLAHLVDLVRRGDATAESAPGHRIGTGSTFRLR